MKHCKRILALILVAATLLSFSLVAGAANIEFTDAGKITHSQAVGLLSSLGVINGYSNGSFKPDSSVTRAEMAKMLAFVLNGGQDVGEMYTAACTFADAKGHWAAGYIGYCVSAGLINGRNANTFDPDGQVTGYEAAKMMLCALGYKADLNGLTGPSWNTNTHSLAIKAKLLEELVDYTPAQSLNRDDTSQMIFNTLKATMVETSGTTTVVGKLTITSDVVNTQLANTSSDYRGSAGYDAMLQLIEDVFPELKLQSSSNDRFGRPCTTWTLKGSDLGVYPVSSAIGAQDTAIAAGNVYSALNGATPKSCDVFFNGVLTSSADYNQVVDTLTSSATTLSGTKQAALIAAKNDIDSVVRQANGISNADLQDAMAAISGTNQISSMAYAAESTLCQVWGNRALSLGWYYTRSSTGPTAAPYGSGCSRVEVFYDSINEKLTVCWGYYYCGEVIDIIPEILDADGNVVAAAYAILSPTVTPPNINSWNSLPLNDTVSVPGSKTAIPVLLDDIKTGELTLKKGSHVAYYAGTNKTTNPGAGEIDTVILLDKTTGELTMTRQSAGQDYDGRIRTKNNVYYYDVSGNNNTTHTVGSTYDIYYSVFGTRNYFFFTQEVFGGYVYIYNAGEKIPAVTSTYQAKLIKADGTMEIVETDKNYMTNVGYVAKTSVDAAGKTVLIPVGESSGNFNVKVSINNSNATVTFDGTPETADTTTRFVIGSIDSQGNESFAVYTGIQNVPSITSTKYYAYFLNDNGVLDTVYLVGAAGMSSATHEGMLVKTGKETMSTGKFGNSYTMQAIVGGEITTLTMTPTAYAALGANGVHLFGSYTTDANNIITGFTTISGTPITSFVPAEAGNVILNGTAMTYADYVLVYTYSVSSGTLAISNVDSLYQLNNTYPSYYTLHETYANKPLAGIFAVID